MTTVRNYPVTRVVRGGRGPVGPAGAGLRAWQTVTDDHTAAAGDRLICDSTADAFAVTLPAAGGEAWIRGVGDAWTANPVTLDGNGRTFEGDDTLVLDGDAAGFLIHLTSQDDAWLYTLTFQHGAD